MDENKLLLATIEEKYDRFLERDYMISTDFLNLQQQAQARLLLRKLGAARGFFYGGFPDAERRQLFFVPDYMGITKEEELAQWFAANPQECPLALLHVTYHRKGAGRALTHRDFLGSLLAEGIRREKTGDILVEEERAQIVIARELATYLEAHYSRAGSVELEVKVAPVTEIRPISFQKENVEVSVSSPRLDNIVAAAFHVSRKEAVLAITQGKVFVEGLEINKPDFNLHGGEKVVLRGKGKVRYLGTVGTSKKGKLHVTLEKYI